MVHKVTVESDDEKLQSQVEEPVEEIVEQAPAQPQVQNPEVQTQTQTVQTQAVMTEEERIFGTDEDAKKLFENPERKKVFV